MILKIQRFCDDQIWWLLDDIRKISISETLDFSREEYGQECEANLLDGEIHILDRFSNSEQLDPKPEKRFPYVRLICKLSNGNEFTVIFDTIAYLCNDLGKTIEKLTVS